VESNRRSFSAKRFWTVAGSQNNGEAGLTRVLERRRELEHYGGTIDVGNASIELIRERQSLGVTTSDAFGDFKISGLAPGGAGLLRISAFSAYSNPPPGSDGSWCILFARVRAGTMN
jgi:hypothetical protein